METGHNMQIPDNARHWQGDVGTMTMHDLLALASKLYMCGQAASQSQLNNLMKTIRRRAAQELEVGDGVRFETVRVERKLDGSVSIFFGI